MFDVNINLVEELLYDICNTKEISRLYDDINQVNNLIEIDYKGKKVFIFIIF